MDVWKERIKDHNEWVGQIFDPKRGLLFLEDGTTELMEDKSLVIEDENGSLSGERQIRRGPDADVQHAVVKERRIVEAEKAVGTQDDNPILYMRQCAAES
eukprot:scaffold1944_cov86-Cylindrotheca_fusiformis.AAC.3